MSIVINTPTSNIGRALAARLLDAGESITILSRDKKKVEELHRRGARVIEGSFEDPALLAEALKGAESLFWLTPPPARPVARLLFALLAGQIGRRDTVFARIPSTLPRRN
jgi:uncharacterized protein YbjT (DUF2867 family)